ncbi:MAG: alpha/beta fold hydrolase [Solirubrobacterales bacterium]|jgi:pimeloyl-ACP methyl ester carboxylesterase|nr:alpha/beta fold hydrolase [Solirubrobacterales bacterium]
MAEQHIAVAPGIALCHETFGDPGDPVVLLVMGLGTQMLAWRVEFCEQLAREGFFVVRYDNRDVGRSTHFSDHRPPSLKELVLRRPKDVAYTLDDMAEDAAGLIDALGLGAAHVVGASMGGMIAQQLAVRHPDKVLSLVSIMSTTGARRVGQPALKVLPFLVKPPSREREEAIERVVQLFGLVGSPGFERDVAETREMAGESFDRSSDRRGAGRQLAAILAAGDRTAGLRRITAPTLVVHGTDDKLVAPSGGKATAKAIAGARLELVRGMGHDIPRGAWDEVIGLIAGHARAVDARTSGARTP